MGRHVVWPLAGVDKWGTFGAQLVGRSFHIHTDVRIGVLVDRETGRGMLDEDLEHSEFDLLEVFDRIDDLACNQVKPTTAGAKFDGRLGPMGQRFTSAQKKFWRLLV